MNPKYIVSILAVLAIGYAVLWASVGMDAKRAFVDELEMMRDQGADIDYDPPKLGGFPYRMEVSTEKLEIFNERSGYSLQAKNVMLIGHVWKQDHWFVQSGDFTARLTNNLLFIDGAKMVSSARYDQYGGLNLGIDLSEAMVFSKLTEDEIFTGDQIEMYLQFPGAKAYDTSELNEAEKFRGFLRLKKIRNEARDVLDAGELDFTWHGNGPDSYTKSALEAWRDQGGTMEVQRLSMLWGTDELLASLSLSLDENLRPIGAGSLKVNGDPFQRLIDWSVLEDTPTTISEEMFLSGQFGRLEINGEKVGTLPRLVP